LGLSEHFFFPCSKLQSFDWYKHDGQYSKGKVHCGCGLCKFGRKYGVPTVKDMREMAREKILLEDYEV